MKGSQKIVTLYPYSKKLETIMISDSCLNILKCVEGTPPTASMIFKRDNVETL